MSASVDPHFAPAAGRAPESPHLSDSLELAGIQRVVEVGIAIAPTTAGAPAAAKALASFLDAAPEVAVRLAGVGSRGSRLVLTLAVTLGSVDDVKAATPAARAAVVLLQRIVDEFAAYEPAFTVIPDSESDEAVLARELTACQVGVDGLIPALHADALVRS
jgi:hypothetical protein